MRRPEPEALYGGAAGGGKSDALIIEALRQVQIPHYRGLILRKTFPQLSDLVDKSLVYYRRAFPEAQYNATSHVWVFPSGAKIYFGSMQYTKDRTNYQGKAFDFIGFDELTHFEWEEYSYMMSRNRPTPYFGLFFGRCGQMESIRMDLPAPVSPVSTFSPGSKCTSAFWITATFSICRLLSMASFSYRHLCPT